MTWQRAKAVFLPGIACAVLGCGLDRPVDSVVIGSPVTWAEVGKGVDGEISTGWLKEFSDQRLRAEVLKAVSANRSLKAAAARFEEARQETIAVRAARYVQADATADAGVRDGSGQRRSQDFGVNLAASWEVDLWGRLRDLTAAAEADELVAREDLRGARLSVAANAAKAYANLVSSQQEVALAEFTLDSFEKNLRIIGRNYKATGEGALDIKFARTNVASAQRELEARRLDAGDAARALEVLQASYPDGDLRGGRDLPDLRSVVPAGMPAGLIERRPDLAAARAAILASARRADAARKSLLPDFALSGSGGNRGARFGDLLRLDFLVAQILGNVRQILADGGASAAEARAALARNERRIMEYAQLSLEAFREVEASLAADRSLKVQEGFLLEEVKQASLAERQAERDYAEGINPNILSVLEAQRRATGARAALLRLKNARLQNRFDLHLALGGDFTSRP